MYVDMNTKGRHSQYMTSRQQHKNVYLKARYLGVKSCIMIIRTDELVIKLMTLRRTCL